LQKNRGFLVSARGASAVEAVVAIDTPNALNRREHWGSRARRTRLQRKAVAEALRGVELPWGAWLVTLTRRSQNLADADSLVGGCLKAVRDEVASALTGGDDSARAPCRWRYSQAITREKRKVRDGRGKRLEEVDSSVTIRIEGAGELAPRRRQALERIDATEQRPENEPGAWRPPYASAEAAYAAQLAWLNLHPDERAPWEDDDVPAPPPVTFPSRPPLPSRPEREAPAKPRRPVGPPPPPPPWPEGFAVGTRVRVLTGPVNSYGRSETRDGRVETWDGVALGVRLDGLEGLRRYVVSRVSPLDVWGNPVYPARVTWIRGDRAPVLAPPAPTQAPPPVDDQFPKPEASAPPVASAPIGPRPYPGFFVR
jgi:hypothetical protein